LTGIEPKVGPHSTFHSLTYFQICTLQLDRYAPRLVQGSSSQNLPINKKAHDLLRSRPSRSFCSKESHWKEARKQGSKEARKQGRKEEREVGVPTKQ
jgi:hypothetical protein